MHVSCFLYAHVPSYQSLLLQACVRTTAPSYTSTLARSPTLAGSSRTTFRLSSMEMTDHRRHFLERAQRVRNRCDECLALDIKFQGSRSLSHPRSLSRPSSIDLSPSSTFDNLASREVMIYSSSEYGWHMRIQMKELKLWLRNV